MTIFRRRHHLLLRNLRHPDHLHSLAPRFYGLRYRAFRRMDHRVHGLSFLGFLHDLLLPGLLSLWQGLGRDLPQ
jgi:hypothetical protein